MDGGIVKLYILSCLGFLLLSGCTTKSVVSTSMAEKFPTRVPAGSDECAGKTMDWLLTDEYNKALAAYCVGGQDGSDSLMQLLRQIKEKKAEFVGGNGLFGVEDYAALALTGFKLDTLMVYTTVKNEMRVAVGFSAADKTRPVWMANAIYKVEPGYFIVVKKNSK